MGIQWEMHQWEVDVGKKCLLMGICEGSSPYTWHSPTLASSREAGRQPLNALWLRMLGRCFIQPWSIGVVQQLLEIFYLQLLTHQLMFPSQKCLCSYSTGLQEKAFKWKAATFTTPRVNLPIEGNFLLPNLEQPFNSAVNEVSSLTGICLLLKGGCVRSGVLLKRVCKCAEI